MSALEDLQARAIVAMKAGQKEEVQALRFLISELQRTVKDSGHTLSAEEELKVLRKARKSRLEAAEAFHAGGREELALKEEHEAQLIGEFLPRELDEQALAALVDQVVTECGASSPKDMGRVMSLLMERAGAQVDGRTASRLVKERLSA